MSAGVHLVHGMGPEAVPADWPALTPAEVDAVLGAYGLPPATSRWDSPRPLSAAAVVDTDGGGLVVKRHHISVRSPEALREEHGFAAHLRAGGVPVPAVRTTPRGATVHRRGAWVYEVHDRAAGVDRYRDAPSWTPWHSVEDARAAGTALARFHQVARTYRAPGRVPGRLVVSAEVALADDPIAAIDAVIGRSPSTVAYLAPRRGWRAEMMTALSPLYAALGHRARAWASSWTHGDWHASNLMWADGGVAAVIDLGLANRTFALYDLATALERHVVAWLDLGSGDPAVERDQAVALVDGYRSILGVHLDDLVRLLPVVHVELALAEVEYFTGVTGSEANADLAWDGYLLGHALWFRTPSGRALLDDLAATTGR